MARLVLVDHGSEATFWASNRAIDQRQLGDIVLVDHIEDGLFLDSVDDGVLHVILVGGCDLVESVGGDKLGGVVLGHPVNSIEWSGETCGVEAVDGRLEFPFLEE